MVFLLPAAAVADKVPVTVEAVIVNAYHIPVFQFRLGMIITMRHHKTEEKIISGSFGNPCQCLFVAAGAIVGFIVFQEIYAKIGDTHFLEIADIILNPFFGSRFIHIHPIQRIVERFVSHNVSGMVRSSFYRQILFIGGTGQPHGVVIDSHLHAPFLQVFSPVAETVFPVTVVLGDIAVLIDGLCSFYPSVVADHVVTVGFESLLHPVDVCFPALLTERNVGYKTLFVGNPVSGSRTVTGEGTVTGYGRLGTG